MFEKIKTLVNEKTLLPTDRCYHLAGNILIKKFDLKLLMHALLKDLEMRSTLSKSDSKGKTM